jgi:hypothetical protein
VLSSRMGQSEMMTLLAPLDCSLESHDSGGPFHLSSSGLASTEDDELRLAGSIAESTQSAIKSNGRSSDRKRHDLSRRQFRR